VLKDAVRTKLTQSLGPVSLDICRCADEEVDEIFGLSEQWQQWEVRKHTQELIAKLSTQVFLGQRMTKNKEWIRIAVDYTVDMMLAVRELRLTPASLRPIVHWFLPHCYYLRQDRTSARKIIDEEIRVRQREREAAAARGEPPSKKSDSIGWVTELADGAPIDISGIQLSFTFAAIHTTSDMVSKTLYYLAADPQLRHAIREEIVHVLTTQGWKKTALTSMRLLDSTMKEVQRIHAPA
jgi:cytochrome P450